MFVFQLVYFSLLAAKGKTILWIYLWSWWGHEITLCSCQKVFGAPWYTDPKCSKCFPRSTILRVTTKHCLICTDCIAFFVQVAREKGTKLDAPVVASKKQWRSKIASTPNSCTKNRNPNSLLCCGPYCFYFTSCVRINVPFPSPFVNTTSSAFALGFPLIWTKQILFKVFFTSLMLLSMHSHVRTGTEDRK